MSEKLLRAGLLLLALTVVSPWIVLRAPTSDRAPTDGLVEVTVEAGSRHGVVTPAQSIATLAHRLREAPPGSSEARSIQRQIDRVRRKAAQTEPRAENPGALREALTQLKTGRDGTTYPANYKSAALARARRAPHSKVPRPWQERGPGNVSGRARAIVVDSTDPLKNTWFVATIGGGVWKTADRGNTWTHKTPELESLSCTTLAQSQSNPDVFYVGTGMGYGRVVELEGAGIWKSTDHGESWFQLASTADGQILRAINRMVVDPDDEDVVVVCSNDSFSHLGPKGGQRVSGIFRSTDGGQSWTQTFDADAVFGTQTDNRVQQIVADPTNFDNLYAAVNEVGVIKSVDAGITWTVSADNFALASDIGRPTGNGFGLAGISVRTELAIAPSDPTRIYAAVERPRGVGDIYMSEDSGGSWFRINDITGDPNWFSAFGVSGASGSYTAGWFDNTIAVHPFDENVIFVGGVNLYRMNIAPANRTRASTPIGWWIPNPQGIPVVHADHHWIEIVPLSPPNFRLLDANDGGLAYTSNGGSTWFTTTGMVTTQFYGADKKPGENVYIGGMQDNGTWHSSVDPGPTSNWTSDLGGDGFEVAWNGADPDLVLGGSQFGNLSRSTDGGQSWISIPGATAGNQPFITKIANGKTDPDLVFVVGDQGVKRSDDFGLTWTLTPIQGNWLGYRPFDNVEISIADPQVVWISSRMDVDAASGIPGGIHVSADGGLSFNEISQNFPPVLTESSGIGTHPTEAGTAYMLFSVPGTPKVMRTIDYGETWEDLSGFSGPGKASVNGFPDVAVFSLLVMPFDTEQLWAGTEIGLFVSEDGGASWQFADDGLPHVAVFELSIVDEQVIAATQGRGVWSASLSELAGYTPPTPTLAPRIGSLALAPSGDVNIEVDLRSAYDSTTVWLDGIPLVELDANEGPETRVVPFNVVEETTITVSVTSFKGERTYRTPSRDLDVFPLASVASYESDFEFPGASADIAANGFSVGPVGGFTDAALHTVHPYAVQTEYTAVLKKPIRVAAANAELKYSDVCLVEEGTDPNYTDPNFWDYVIVEATEDGLNWVPLIPGYDSRADPAWLARYRQGVNSAGNSTTTGTETLYVEHTIDLLETFDPGDEILVRFRLFSDPLAWAWGWAIDDLDIQTSAVSLGEQETPDAEVLPLVASLSQNQPNPFNPSTTIEYSLPYESRVELVVYDTAGRRVRGLVQGAKQPAGQHVADWDGRDDGGRRVASGIYVVRLETPDFVRSRKMTLMK